MNHNFWIPSYSLVTNLKHFLPHKTPISHSQPPRASSNPQNVALSRRKSPPPSRESKEILQQRLEKAVHFRDVDACIYLLQNSKHLYLKHTDMRALVATAFAHRTPDLAIALVQSLPPPDKKKSFSVLMKECLVRRDVQSLDSVLSARAASGFPEDAYTASARITALGSAGRVQDAYAMLTNVWERPECRTVEVCNAAIGAAAFGRSWDTAEASFNLLTSSGICADIVTYNSLIKAAGAAGLGVAKIKRLFSLLQRSGLAPSHQTYTVLFSAIAKSSTSSSSSSPLLDTNINMPLNNSALACTQDEEHEEEEQDDIIATPLDMWLFHTFHSMDLTPNDYILSAFFSAVAATPSCSRPQLESIFTILAEARSRGPLNDTVYTTLLKLITRHGMAERAVDVWRAAQQDGVVLSSHIFSALFAACAAGTSPALVDVALDAYDELREWWEALDKERIPDWAERDALWAYNSLLHFVGADGRLDEALGIFESMKRDGPLPDMITFNTVIAAAAQCGDRQVAVDLFREMTKAGIEPSERTYGALLHAFAKLGDADGASGVIQSLIDAGIQPNTVMYTSFLHALVTSGTPASLDAAFSLAEEMQARGCELTQVTYGCLLLACDKLGGDVDRAFRVYQQACDQGIMPSDEMHDILIGVCTKGGRLDDALELVKAMARTHAALQQHTMDSLVRALSGSYPLRALRMLGLMQAKGMGPSPATYQALVTSCARASESAEALTLYKSMKAQGMELNGVAGSALITCLCAQSQQLGLGFLEQAVGVYSEMMLTAFQNQEMGHYQEVGDDVATPGVLREYKNKNNPNMMRQKKSALPKRAAVPDANALAALTQAFAVRGDFRAAWKYYKQLRRSSAGMEEACISQRRMFEVLIEGFCRGGGRRWIEPSSCLMIGRRPAVIGLFGVVVEVVVVVMVVVVVPLLLQMKRGSLGRFHRHRRRHHHRHHKQQRQRRIKYQS